MSTKVKSALGAIVVVGLGVGGLMAAPPAQASGTCVSANLRAGSKSYCVGYAQTMLNVSSPGPALSADNDFGPRTRASVIAMQKEWHAYYRSVSVDGVIGRRAGKYCAIRKWDRCEIHGSEHGKKQDAVLLVDNGPHARSCLSPRCMSSRLATPDLIKFRSIYIGLIWLVLAKITMQDSR